jgi:IS1 family transposase
MTCKRCHHVVRKFGTYGKRRIQRYRCTLCKITFSEPAPRLGTHYTDPETAAKVLNLMLEGMSVRAIERITGMHRDTILALMNTAATKARAVLDAKVQNISPKFVQLDEMWGYVHTREPNLNNTDPAEWGSVYLWLAIDSETKLLITHHFGDRNGVAAHAFVSDLRKRTTGRYQITSDQLNAYVGAIREYFGVGVDFAQLHKIYGKLQTENWYGGGYVVGAVPHVKIGRPDYKYISTSFIERTNLNVRMHMRRFTRLTNAFSKTLANMKDAVALYIAFYNFCRVHGSLSKQTPAMRAGLTDHVWTVQELLTAV